MRRLPFAWIAPTVIVATALISWSQLAAQAPSAKPQEPSSLGEMFRIDQLTGAPATLERVKVKQHKIGQVRSGFLQPPKDQVNFYIEGGASPVVFKAAEPQQFVIRLMSPGDRYGREFSPEELLKHVGLNRLAVQSVKSHDERIVTKTNILLDIQTYGQLTLGLDPQKPDRAAQSFRLTTHIALTPGEYDIWIRATHDSELIANGFVGNEDWAFEIVER